MAYDRIRQTHPGAPAAVGARVVERATGRLGTIAPPVPGGPGVRVRFDGSFPPRDCEPDSLDWAAPPPAPPPLWCAR